MSEKCFYCDKELRDGAIDSFILFTPFTERYAIFPKQHIACKDCYSRHHAYDAVIENGKKRVGNMTHKITDWGDLDGIENSKYRIHHRRSCGYETLSIRLKTDDTGHTPGFITVNYLSMDNTIKWLAMFGFDVEYDARRQHYCPRCHLEY
jgi:hypothetical protein